MEDKTTLQEIYERNYKEANETIKRYKEKYPNKTIRFVEAHTKINGIVKSYDSLDNGEDYTTTDTRIIFGILHETNNGHVEIITPPVIKEEGDVTHYIPWHQITFMCSIPEDILLSALIEQL